MPAQPDTITADPDGILRAGILWPNPPAAIANLAVGEWAAVSANTLASIDPEDDPAENPNHPGDAPWHAVEGQKGVIDDWNGGAFAPNIGTLGSLIYWGGGHNGYYGNEIYLFDVETLSWSRHTSPTRAADNGATNKDFGIDPVTGLFHDGAPLPPHTYAGVLYDTQRKRFWEFANQDQPANPPGIPDPDGGYASRFPVYFDFDAGAWSVGPEMPRAAGVSAVSVHDSSGDAAWVSFQQALSWIRIDLGTGAIAEQPTPDVNSVLIDTVAAIDPGRRLLVWHEGRQAGVIYASEIDDLTTPGQIVTTSGGATPQSISQMGMEWVSEIGAFLFWSSGLTYYTLTPPAGDWKTGTWQWQTHVGTGTAPGAAPNGPFTRFRYVPSLGVAFICNDVTQPTYAVRIHSV